MKYLISTGTTDYRVVTASQLHPRYAAIAKDHDGPLWFCSWGDVAYWGHVTQDGRIGARMGAIAIEASNHGG